MSPGLVVLIAMALVVALLAVQPRLGGGGDPEKTVAMRDRQEQAVPPAGARLYVELGRGGLPFPEPRRPEPRRLVVKLGRGGLPFPEETAVLVSSANSAPPSDSTPSQAPPAPTPTAPSSSPDPAAGPTPAATAGPATPAAPTPTAAPQVPPPGAPSGLPPVFPDPPSPVRGGGLEFPAWLDAPRAQAPPDTREVLPSSPDEDGR
jgi:hypothetical protein